MKSRVSIILVLVMVIGVMASCGNSATARPGAASQAPAGERVTLSMFTTDAGIAIPTGADPSNNAWVNIAKEYANVDIDYEIIPWGDMQTRTNLLLASGNYPDIVHTAYNPNVQEVEDAGGFIDLLPYYNASQLMQGVIEREYFLTYAKNVKNDAYYYMPMSNANYPYGFGNMVNITLVNLLNDGVIPETIDEYIDLAYRVKENNPNAAPFSAWCPEADIFAYNSQFWSAYGVHIRSGVLQQGRDEVFTLMVDQPMFKEAATFHKMLYDEGLLSRTWATHTDYSQWANDQMNNDLLLYTDSVQQAEFGFALTDGEVVIADPLFIMAPPFKEYPVATDVAQLNNRKRAPMDIGHRVHISTTSKYPDQAWKFIEGLATSELFDQIFWGDEGVSFQYEGGDRVVIPEGFTDPNRTWGMVYAMILGYGAGFESSRAAWRYNMIAYAPQLIPILDLSLKNREMVTALATDPFPGGLTDLLADEIITKAGEAHEEQSAIITQYIMGILTESQFDTAVDAYREKWQHRADAYNEAYTDRHINKTR